MTIAYRINPGDYSVALSLADASPVYFKLIDRDKSEVIDPATGEQSTMPLKAFEARYVPRAACPPALKEKAHEVIPYREWQKKMNERGGK